MADERKLLLAIKLLLLAFRDHAKTKAQKDAIEAGIQAMEQSGAVGPRYNWRHRR